MNDTLKFKVRSPFTGDEEVVEYEINHRRWSCTRCGKGPRCIHAEAVIHTLEVEQIVEQAKKPKPMPPIADGVDRNWDQESSR